MSSNLSLYIPCVCSKVDKKYIANAFKHIGTIKTIYVNKKEDGAGKRYHSVYIHFHQWHDTECARTFYTQVMNENEPAHLYHSYCLYWTVLPNIGKRHKPEAKNMVLEAKDLDLEAKNMVLELEAKNMELDLDLEDLADMEELEQFIEEEDMHLITIDERYVQSLEEENNKMNAYIQQCELTKFNLCMENNQLRAALIHMETMYRAEAAKFRSIHDMAFNNTNTVCN